MTTTVHSTAPSFTGALRPVSFVKTLLGLEATWRQRQELSQLPTELLKDIGVTREEARREANRGLWDAPGHWRG